MQQPGFRVNPWLIVFGALMFYAGLSWRSYNAEILPQSELHASVRVPTSDGADTPKSEHVSPASNHGGLSPDELFKEQVKKSSGETVSLPPSHSAGPALAPSQSAAPPSASGAPASATPSQSAPAPAVGRSVMRYRRVAGAEVAQFMDFEGTPASHLTTRSCISIAPYEGHEKVISSLGPFVTCNFTNLYYDSAISTVALPHYIYVHELTNESPAEADAKVNAILEELRWVSPMALHWYPPPGPNTFAIRWRVVGVKGEPKTRAVGDAQCECDKRVAPGGDFNKLVVNCQDPSPSCRQGAQVNWQSYIIQRETPPNIGHWTWDNLIPIHSAMEDLGLGSKRGDVQLLMYELDLDGWIQPKWEGGQSSLTRAATYATYRQEPLFLDDFRLFVQGKLVLFKDIVIGQAGRSAHDIIPIYSTYNANNRLLWKYRHSVLDVMNLLGRDKDNSKGYAGKQRIVMLQKPDKRVIMNIDEVKQSIERSLVESSIAADVVVVDWKDVGGFQKEVEFLLDTNIVISMDGTGANNLLFMPPGSVHISLGVRSAGGHANQADFLFSGVDHVRVLYYCCQQPGDHQENTNLDVATVTGLTMQAARLVRSGFPVPLPFYLNHAKSGYVCQYIYHRHAALSERGRQMYLQQSSHFCRDLMLDPVGMWNRYLPSGPPPPANLGQEVADAIAEYERFHAQHGLG